MFTVHFTVHTNAPALAPLYDNELTKADGDKWIGTITLTGVDVVKFRYFIGYYLESELNKPATLIVSKWETHLTPRSVMPAVEASKTRVCRANVYDIFGFHGGKEIVTQGWIHNDEQNQILLTVTGAALKFYKTKHVQQNYRIKIVPVDLRNKHDSQMLDDDPMETSNGAHEDMGDAEADDNLPNLPSFSRTEIAPLNSDDPKFRDQSEFGELFHNSVDYLLYRTCSVAVEYLSFRIEIYSTTRDEIVAVASVPLLTNKGLPVGKIYFGYLFVRPIRVPHPPQTMKASYAKHWKKRTTLEVGHRGMGNSYTKCAVARENTLHSLNSAAKNGADFVEFDVHLTKDKIAIVFHDFHVMVSVAKRSPSVTEDGISPALAVKDLKLNQLRLLHLDHVKHQGNDSDSSGGECTPTAVNHHKVTARHDEAEEHKPFPTLVEAFRNVSEEVGFNVEIKYPMMQMDGVNECENYYERNMFVDIILADVINHAGQRRIVFSSFDPDICTMISLKQNKYPVLFLCLGHDTKHTAFVDERTRTSMTAVKFAAGVGIMGVNFNSEDVLRDPAPIYKAREYGLISFTLLVDGVIYDRIGESESRSNVFTIEKNIKAALFSKKLPSPITSPRPTPLPTSTTKISIAMELDLTTATASMTP
uniref:GP-PDE domain-containing protein n=1 Tax=Ditylenchus dipsaci TaxID=166011 RepID=A0A915ESG3_9BILA